MHSLGLTQHQAQDRLDSLIEDTVGRVADGREVKSSPTKAVPNRCTNRLGKYIDEYTFPTRIDWEVDLRTEDDAAEFLREVAAVWREMGWEDIHFAREGSSAPGVYLEFDGYNVSCTAVRVGRKAAIFSASTPCLPEADASGGDG